MSAYAGSYLSLSGISPFAITITRNIHLGHTTTIYYTCQFPNGGGSYSSNALTIIQDQYDCSSSFANVVGGTDSFTIEYDINTSPVFIFDYTTFFTVLDPTPYCGIDSCIL